MKKLFCVGLIVSCLAAQAEFRKWDLSLNDWGFQQTQISIVKMLQNMSPSNALPGATIASPERLVTDYYFHWVRDSALTYMTVFRLYEEASGSGKAMYKQRLLDFANFSKYIQRAAPLGKPKFYVYGKPYTGPWCEPQNDGPALRAITLIQFAQSLLRDGQTDLVKKNLLPVIRKDIEFVKNVWPQTSCDLWEEVYGDHFYTRMVQRRALYEAKKIAALLNQSASALQNEIDTISTELLKHYDSERGFFVATLNFSGGLNTKRSNLDSSVALAFLHGHTDDGFLPYTDPRVVSTMQALLDGFKFYPVNADRGRPGIAIGRYPEDFYFGGNPWVLLTAATSQIFYRASAEAKESGHLASADLFLKTAEQQLQRVQLHAPADGALAEQMDKNSGYMMGARDLTWSHTETLEAIACREMLATTR